jgi:hypothetical protein
MSGGSQSCDAFSTILLATIIIALLMEAVNTSETSVNFYQKTRLNVPEESRVLSAVTFAYIFYTISNPYEDSEFGFLFPELLGLASLFSCNCEL